MDGIIINCEFLFCLYCSFALRVDEPAKLTDKSSADENALYEKWERSNRTLISLPTQFGSFKINYNTQREKRLLTSSLLNVRKDKTRNDRKCSLGNFSSWQFGHLEKRKKNNNSKGNGIVSDAVSAGTSQAKEKQNQNKAFSC